MNPAAYPYGSPQSRAAARWLLESRKYRTATAEDLKVFDDTRGAHIRMKELFDAPLGIECLDGTCNFCFGQPPTKVLNEEIRWSKILQRAKEEGEKLEADWMREHGEPYYLEEKRQKEKLREMWFQQRPDRREKWEAKQLTESLFGIKFRSQDSQDSSEDVPLGQGK